MTTKSYLGITLFILLLISLIHVYQRTDLDGPSSRRSHKYTSTSQKAVPEPVGVDFDEFSDGSSLDPNPFREKQWEGAEKPAPKPTWENSSYEYHLLKRIANSDLPDDVFLQGHLRRQEQRHARRDAACASMGGRSSAKGLKSSLMQNLWVNDKYRFVYCSIPKVACTSWKSVLLVLAGVADTTNQFPQKIINSRSSMWMKQLWQYPPDERQHILETYTKFVFSRDPFSRLLSAFQNKLSPNSSFIRASRWQDMLGTKILHEFRDGWRRKKDKYDLKFSEFARFVSTGHGFNKHWNIQASMCLPCDLDYTILGHFETLDEDADFILRLVGADGLVSFPSSNYSSPTNSSSQQVLTSHYNTLSSMELRDLYKVYQKDFELFGYPPPDRLKG